MSGVAKYGTEEYAFLQEPSLPGDSFSCDGRIPLESRWSGAADGCQSRYNADAVCLLGRAECNRSPERETHSDHRDEGRLYGKRGSELGPEIWVRFQRVGNGSMRNSLFIFSL